MAPFKYKSNSKAANERPREVSFAPLSQLIFTPTPSVLYACWCRWKCLPAATIVNEAKATSRRPEDGLEGSVCERPSFFSTGHVRRRHLCRTRTRFPTLLEGALSWTSLVAAAQPGQMIIGAIVGQFARCSARPSCRRGCPAGDVGRLMVVC